MSLCSDQNTFNTAVTNALNNYQQTQVQNQTQNWKQAGLIVFAIWIILTIWAVMLALQVTDPSDRILNIFLAIVSPPFYLISYFINNLSMK